MHIMVYQIRKNHLDRFIEVDIEVIVSTKLAAKNDDLSKTIDYTLLFEIAKKNFEQKV